MDTRLSGLGSGGTADAAGPSAPGHVVVRDLRPEDEALYPAFLDRVSTRDRRLRFFSPAPLSERQIHRFTHYEPSEAIVLAAVDEADSGLVAVGRLHRVEGDRGEFAILVRSDRKGHGIGRRLLGRLCDEACRIGVREVVGLILSENACMRGLVTQFGFRIDPDPQERGVMRATLTLPPEAGAKRAA